MRRVGIRFAFASVTLACVLATLAAPVGALHRRQDNGRGHQDEERCRERVAAGGEVRITQGRALTSAWNHWKEEVTIRYGLEFAQPKDAKGISKKCFDAGRKFGWQYQCEIVATPCLVHDLND